MAVRKRRCAWAESSDLMRAYHDDEWGVPSHDDRHLFEMLVLEGAQAGLSWSTILNKRAAYRRAFDGFDPARVARYRDARAAKLLADPGIVRNRLKIASTVTNAKAFLAVRKEFGSFSAYAWAFVGGKPVRRRRGARVPARRGPPRGPAPAPRCPLQVAPRPRSGTISAECLGRRTWCTAGEAASPSRRSRRSGSPPGGPGGA